MSKTREMIKISHRGNLRGPNKDRENNPQYIKEALEKGYNVEVDVWLQGTKLFLGHDEPQYETNIEFLMLFSKHFQLIFLCFLLFETAIF